MIISNLPNNPPKEQDKPAVLKCAIPRHSMQFLLCAVSDNQNEEEPNNKNNNNNVQIEQGPAKKAKLATPSVIPDKDRKRSYRLSAKRRQCRLDNEALASRAYNLTLDVNNLKQQVRYLQDCRDLYVTRLAVARQHAEGEAVGMVTRLFRLFCHETCGTNEQQPDDRLLFLSRVHERLTDASAGGRDGIPLFMQTWRNFKLLFTHRSYTVKSIRLVSHVGAHDCEDHSTTDVDVVDEARQRCGPSGGCVVESAGEFTGRLKRDAIAAIYPKLLQDEELVTRLIGRKFPCSLRLKAYFNARGQLVDHVAEFDVLGALNEVILSTR